MKLWDEKPFWMLPSRKRLRTQLLPTRYGSLTEGRYSDGCGSRTEGFILIDVIEGMV